MSYENKKVYSENPYVDVVTYYVKQLGLGTVLKMEQEAAKHETVESRRLSDFLLECVEGTLTYDGLDVLSSNTLDKLGIIGDLQYPYLINPDRLPEDMRKQALEYEKQEFISKYEELNDYYRMLNGLPPLGYEDVYTDWVPPDNLILDLTVPVHKMPMDTLTILDSYGVLEDMISEDPINRAYLRYVLNPIDPYFARKAPNFAVLYIPSIEKQEIYNEYRERLGINREYAIYAVYSEAYRYESDYYDNFIAVFIVLSTIIDLISRVGEFITRREVFDIRTVKYIFDSYGIDFFAEIPLKYQIRMIKNLHILLKFKSTPKNMIDICQLFGFNNIKIFKYYLLKSRNIVDRPDLGFSFTGDNDTDFDMKFAKIPIDEPMDEYIRDHLYWQDYDAIVSQDPKWNGGLDHDYVKQQHLDLDFNYTRTKYISIDSMYDLAKISMQQAYFLNMLYDNMEYERDINLSIPYLGTGKFNIADIFIFLNALTYQYNNMKDLITDTPTKAASILGFNFHADLEYMHQCLDNIGWGLNTFNVKIKGVEDFESFIEPTESIPNLETLVYIYHHNTDILKTIKRGMKTADNLKDYNTFKYLYDSLMVIDLTFDHFADPETGELYKDSEGDATYTEYLRHRSPALYSKLIKIGNMDDDEAKVDLVSNLIDNICYVLDAYMDTDEFSGLFYNLPVVSMEAVKGYIKTVIDFYKSYKVHFLGLNTIYYLNDPYDGWIKIIDWIQLNRWFEKTEIIQPIDGFGRSLVHWTSKDFGLIGDSAMIIRTISRIINPYEFYLPKSVIDMISRIYRIDSADFKDDCTHIAIYEKKDNMEIDDESIDDRRQTREITARFHTGYYPGKLDRMGYWDYKEHVATLIKSKKYNTDDSIFTTQIRDKIGSMNSKSYNNEYFYSVHDHVEVISKITLIDNANIGELENISRIAG